MSRLANLAITITDVQDMDPIFTNLPYSTNIEEGIPLVSTTILQCSANICEKLSSFIVESVEI